MPRKKNCPKIEASFHVQSNMNNGFSSGEDSRGGGVANQMCCLVDDGVNCKNVAGNASYSKRIQKTVTQRR